MKIDWKIVAIVCLVLLLVENILFGWALWSSINENNKMNVCYYDICSDYFDAEYVNNVCFCYEYDVFGELKLAKTEYMK